MVRTAAGFSRAQFGTPLAKWVRPSHVRTDRHWMTAAVIPGERPRRAEWTGAAEADTQGQPVGDDPITRSIISPKAPSAWTITRLSSVIEVIWVSPSFHQ